MPSPPTLSAHEAAARLDVKLATLYSYASRGLLLTLPDPTDPRRRLYRAEEVERLRLRQRARSGHGPVAADALQWGEPVIASAIATIDHGTLRYRGFDAVTLSRAATFEAVAELLWSDATSPLDLRWPPAPPPPDTPPHATPMDRLALTVARLALDDPMRFGPLPDADRARARRLLPTLAAAAAHRPPDATIARTLAGPDASEPLLGAIDAALVLCADHELNASTFAVRVTASTGADLYSALLAGLAALSGPRHGGMCLQVERLFAEVRALGSARLAVGQRLGRGEWVPGFGHPLYPAGDPRATELLRLAPTVGDDAVARDLRSALADAGYPPPTLDFGLVALTDAAGLPPGTSLILFAIGRLAGWVAHALEQRQDDVLLRPRARYVGPPPRELPTSS